MTNTYSLRFATHAKRIAVILIAAALGAMLVGAVSAPSAQAASVTSVASMQTVGKTAKLGSITGKKALDKKIAKVAKKNGKNLKKCFNWCAKKIAYSATGHKAIRTSSTWSKSRIRSEAKLAFGSDRYGDCYTYSAAMYCLAKYLGYKTKAVAGTSVNTDGQTLHTSWTEIKIKGKWYIFDAMHPSYGYKVPVGKYKTAWQHYSK